ncbi:hypothetical protein [Rummeliibacillus suwonensis]|uniref:hypothetical protein n=1 Tax=Rummeliibacillus suwonensis TaxID=1306154 RepID=UPI002897D93C|nr:hypothetical protein [Rummeliibacillus suwonensis]
MKYSKPLLSCMLVVGLLSACSTNKDNDDSATKTEQTDQGETGTQTTEETTQTDDETVTEQDPTNEDEQTTNSNDDHSSETINNEQVDIINTIKKQLKTDLPVKLPTFLPLKDGKYLTATTKGEKNKYTVTFYETDQKVKINDPSLKKLSQKSRIASYKVVKYDSVQKANEVISFENFSKAGGQKVNLGHNIIGYQDAGAGALWTGWNEGRWALATHTRTTKPEQGLELAKQAVDFLEDNMLPIPKPNGSIHLDAISPSTENNVKWQNNNTVFTVEKVKEPIDALKIATSIK